MSFLSFLKKVFLVMSAAKSNNSYVNYTTEDKEEKTS